jgi:hypothetical protein
MGFYEMMNQEGKKMERSTAVCQPGEKSRVVLLGILYVLSISIMLLGAGFFVYSAINNVQFQVMSATIPGFIFGMVVLFLGFRYFMSLSKLRAEVMKSSGFSWSNFRKEKKSN